MNGLYCAAGCLIPGAHLPDCPDTTCTGCRPALADVGVICLPCRTRIAHALTLAPDLITHVRAHIPPGGRREHRDTPRRRAGTAAATPTPLSLPAVDAADHLYAQLVSWTVTACDDLHLTGPTPTRAWRTSRGAGQVAGLPAGSTGTEAAPYARWLLAHLDRIAARPWVVELLPGLDPDPDHPPLVTLITQTERSWPLEERPHWLPTRCPDCELRTVRWRPPSDPGLPVTISCTTCGHVIPEDLWDPDTRQTITAHEAAERARAPYQTSTR